MVTALLYYESLITKLEEYSLLNLRGSLEELSGYLLIYLGLSNNCKYALLIFIDMPLQLNDEHNKVIVKLNGSSEEPYKYPFIISEMQLPLPFSVHAFFLQTLSNLLVFNLCTDSKQSSRKKKENPLPFPWRVKPSN